MNIIKKIKITLSDILNININFLADVVLIYLISKNFLSKFYLKYLYLFLLNFGSTQIKEYTLYLIL